MEVSAAVAAGETKTLTITFGWHFPHLDWFSYNCHGADDNVSFTGRGCYLALADKPNNGW
eukprot:SAG31_NODE_32440_length_356_cov_0.568093_1_plen_59_part_10